MKKITTILMMLISISYYGQTYTVSPSNTVTTNIPLNTFLIIPIDQINTGSSPIILKWEFVSDNMNPAWDLSICDFAHCYPGLPLSGTMDTVPVGGKGFIDLNIDTYTTSGTGYVKYYVYQDGFYANGDTITFIVNVGVNGINEMSSTDFIIYPNPADKFASINISNFNSDENKVKIINTLGQVVYDNAIVEQTAKIDVSTFANGIYFIELSDKNNNALQIKKLIVEHK